MKKKIKGLLKSPIVLDIFANLIFFISAIISVICGKSRQI